MREERKEREEEEREKKEREIGEERERDRTKKSCNGQLTKHQFDEPKKGWPPPPLVLPAVLLIHVVEHRVPKQILHLHCLSIEKLYEFHQNLK